MLTATAAPTTVGRGGGARKARSSIVFCSEKYSCVADRAEAEYECDHCRSFQCSACEGRLHEIVRHSFHERRKLVRPSPDKLCQQPSCDERNFADVKCEGCGGLRLCFECDRKTHLTKKSHRRIPILDNRKALASTGGLNDLILSQNDAISHIKPLSPLSDRDDSLTFVSLPQQEDFESCLELENTQPSPPTSKPFSKPNEEGVGGSNPRTDCAPGQRPELTSVMKPKPSPTDSEEKSSENIIRSVVDQKLQMKSQKSPTDLLRDLKIVDKSPIAKDSRWTRSRIPDIAATLPLSPECGKDECDMADLIADSLQRSQMMDDLLSEDLEDSSKVRSFPLANQHEELQVKDEDDFISHLGCDKKALAKVISIFGNTGDGKSYTLNHTFFEGQDIFKTSALQDSCTAGVWVAYDALHRAIVIDTEGMLGVTSNQNQRMRLLLKVLAISDVIIYRTRAERLSSDMFQFLGDASKAYLKHFSVELKSASRRFQLDKAVSTLGPSVVIFHETQHTDILARGASEPAEGLLRNKFRALGLSIDAFSSLQYVGTRTRQQPTDFKSLLWAVKKQLSNNETRCPRNPGVVFRTLKVLNEKFMDEIDKSMPNMFPDQYFTCRSECLSCNKRCVLTMNHLKDGIPHETDREHKCKHQAQFDNTVYTCKACFRNGRTVVVIPKTSASSDGAWLGLASYAWSGYVLECGYCGVIYRSRQHWYGNVDPEKTVVRTEIRHVWPDGNTVLHGSHNAARRLLDGINYVSESIAGVSAKPTRMVTDWVTDKIAPAYWVPNADVKNCQKCKVKFDEKTTVHHCRACGQGFCEACSTKKRPCPERNWGVEPVRVCDTCCAKKDSDEHMTDSGQDASNELMPRKVGEAIGSTVGAIASIVNYPLVAIRDAARPTYWMPDEEIKDCCVCRQVFGIQLKVHHCRACGKGVCDECSPTARPVPSRGWDHPVRVCKTCFGKEKEL